jgi:hypothetical protein
MSKKGKKVINIGDLVRFDQIRNLGIVIDKKTAIAFAPEENIFDLKVFWGNGALFWCLDFTLTKI